jgi:hypothetical protein
MIFLTKPMVNRVMLKEGLLQLLEYGYAGCRVGKCVSGA